MSQGETKFMRGTFSLLWLAILLALTAISIPWIIRLRPQPQAAAQSTPGTPPTAQAAAEIAQTPTPTVQAASPQEPQPGIARIQFWSGNTDNGPIYQLIEEFQAEHPEIQIDLLEYWEHDEQAPDCFASGPTVQSTYARDLLPLLEDDLALKAQFNPAALKAFLDSAPPGQLLSLPMEATPLMIRYNKALFDAAGIPYPKPDWTMEDFLATAQALTRQTDRGMQYGYVSQVGEGEELAIFAAAQGIPVWDEEGRPRFDTPEALAVVQWYADLALKYQVTPIFAPAQPGDLIPGDFLRREELIRSGQVAMWSQFYPYDTMLTKEIIQPPIAQLGWATWPGGVQRATSISYGGFSISPATEYIQACWQWITFLTGSEAATLHSIPARQDVRNLPMYQGQVRRDPALEQYVLDNYTNAYKIHHVDRRWDVDPRPLLNDLLADIFGGTPVAEAIAKVQEQALKGLPTPIPAETP